MPKLIFPANRKHWLALRHADITSSDVAALFGLSPYVTAYELHFQKQEPEPSEFEGNERMKWGNRLEAAIAEGVAEDYGLMIEPFKEYARHDSVERMGSSFDYRIVGVLPGYDNDFTHAFNLYGPGILEIKNVDVLIFKQQWEDDEAPVHIEVQVQHQMEVADYGWTMIAPLVGGNSLKPLLRLRDKETGANICAAVKNFWEGIANNTTPKPDFEKDASFIISLYKDASGQEVDLRGNNQAAFLCGAYKQAAEDEKAAAQRKEACKAELLTLIGNAPKAFANGFTISAGEVAGATITYERKPYRNFRINELKVKG